MTFPSLPRLALLPLALAVASAAIAADAESNPDWGKAADNHIFAQNWVNETMAKNPELIVIGVHADKPGTKDERMIASNLDRIGKHDDDDDKGAAAEGKTVLAPNLTDSGKFEILMPLPDANGNVVGAVGFVFHYHKGQSQIDLLKKATKIRATLSEKLQSLDDLFKPAQ